MKKVVAALLLMSLPVEAVEVKPVVNAQLLGGQYYYKGSESSFGGLASLVASPYMKFNDRWSLVPLYSGSYQGTKQVQDLVGGGTLFQDSQNHDLSVKGIRSFENGLRLKAFTSYGTELLRETEDEDWGDGLYDNRRLTMGAESEWSWKKDNSVRLGYSHFLIRFPNYESLSSQASASGQGREFDAPNVHDSSSDMLTLGSQFSVPGSGLVEAGISKSWTDYDDQHLVDGTGSLTADTRDDSAFMFKTNGTWPVYSVSNFRLYSSIGYTRMRLYSNQNHYDATRTFFNPNYYSYITNSFMNEWTALLGQAPWTVQLNGTVSRQKYADRLVQDSTGAYGTDTTNVDFATLGISVSYPIAKGFQVKALTAFGWNDSNNTYTQVYQYHYNTQNYFMGFTYAY